MTNREIETFLDEVHDIMEPVLAEALGKAPQGGEELHRAMSYTLFAPAKRFRPALALAAARAVGGETERVIPLMVAVEFIHTYSLIHDDLPCMDDDDLRRGKATSHRVFGEGVAILAGDALQALAFGVLARAALGASDGGERELRALAELAGSAGLEGMAGGQAGDLRAAGGELSAAEVENIHRMKTGSLMKASVVGGGHLGGAGREEIRLLGRYGDSLGLAFQVTDDLLNVEGDSRTLGKGVGTDLRQKKATLPAALGLDGTRRRAKALLAECEQALGPLGERGELLRELARYAVDRER